MSFRRLCVYCGSKKGTRPSYAHAAEELGGDSMHERKKLMFDLVDGFVVMPGGYGTLDEFFEIVTWQQLGIHAHPVGLLNVDRYFDPLLKFLDHARDEEFISAENRQLVVDADTPAGLIPRMLEAKKRKT